MADESGPPKPPTPAELTKYWEHLTRDERFYAIMHENDDVLFVLRMHLIFETLMREILEIRYPNADVLLDRDVAPVIRAA
jgi:hypothetical protein